jgi:hypothetical protein
LYGEGFVATDGDHVNAAEQVVADSGVRVTPFDDFGGVAIGAQVAQCQ